MPSGGVPPLLGRRASQLDECHHGRDLGRHRTHRRGHGDDPGRRRRHHAAESFAATSLPSNSARSSRCSLAASISDWAGRPAPMVYAARATARPRGRRSLSAGCARTAGLPGPRPAGPAVEAVPGSNTNVPLWILGSSLYGAQLAAELGLPTASRHISHRRRSMPRSGHIVSGSPRQPSRRRRM